MLYIFFFSSRSGAVEQATNVSRNYSRKQKHEECFSSRISRVVGEEPDQRRNPKMPLPNTAKRGYQRYVSFLPSRSAIGTRIIMEFTERTPRARCERFFFPRWGLWLVAITNQLVIANVFRIPPKLVGLYPRVDRRPSEHIFQVQKCDHQHIRAASASFTMWLWPCVGGWLENPKLFLVASNTSASSASRKKCFIRIHTKHFSSSFQSIGETLWNQV